MGSYITMATYTCQLHWTGEWGDAADSHRHTFQVARSVHYVQHNSQQDLALSTLEKPLHDMHGLPEQLVSDIGPQFVSGPSFTETG